MAVKEKIVIVGAGLVGSLLASYLGREGYSVEVYERRQDPRGNKACEGRSFELALSERGLAPLREIGVSDKILSRVIPMPGRMIHQADGSTQFQPYGPRSEDSLYAVSRIDLNNILIDFAEKSGNVSFKFDWNCYGFDPNKPSVSFKNSNGDDLEVIAERTFGTDGSASRLRTKLGELTSTKPTRDVVNYTYKTFTIASVDGKYPMDPNAFHIWPRGNYVMIAQANQDKSFSSALFLPSDGEISFTKITEDRIEWLFEEKFNDLLPLVPNLKRDYKSNPEGKLCTVRCPTWHFGNKLVLLGDAAHAMVPFYGQGMNCGFEDITELSRHIREKAPDWETVFEHFETARIPNAEAISDLSLSNMREMSEGVANPYLLLAKEIANRLATLFPREILSTHAMVTAHPEIPYNEARRRGNILDRITLDIARSVRSIREVDFMTAKNKILEEY